MIEAQILCCNPCDIPDLGIVGLRRGEQRWVSDTAALSSKDLKKEQAKGNVRVSRKARRVLRAPPGRPPPPFVAQSRPQNNQRPANAPVAEPRVETIIEKTVVQEVDTDKLKAELLSDLLPGLRSAIAEEMGKLTAQNAAQASQAAPAPAAGIDAAQLEGVLESVLRRVGVPTASGGTQGGRKTSGPVEPVFIPKTIVSKDIKAKINVNQKTSEGAGDLDDAEAALRALRGKRRGKKNVNEENNS